MSTQNERIMKKIIFYIDLKNKIKLTQLYYNLYEY